MNFGGNEGAIIIEITGKHLPLASSDPAIGAFRGAHNNFILSDGKRDLIPKHLRTLIHSKFITGSSHSV